MREILQSELHSRGISAYEFEKISGVPQPTTSRFLSGEHGDPRASTVRKWAAALGLREAQLRGLEPIENNRYIKHKESSNVETGPGIRGHVPLISWVHAGEWCGTIDNYAPGDAEEWFPCPVSHGPRTYALRVKGDSMTSPYPGQRSYPEGTVVFVDPDKSVTNGCRLIAKLPHSNEATFKEYREDSGRRYLKPLNPQYQMIEINTETVVCGVVIGQFMAE